MKVAVFGGALVQPGEAVYEDARRLGEMLGKQGHTLLTGGYSGVMEAVSRGAAEAGSHVIGVTCDEIEAFRPVKPNRWVKEIWHHGTLSARLLALIDGCEAAIAMPGGVGTLAEIAMLWNLLLVGAIRNRPLLLVAGGWRGIIEELFEAQGRFITPHDRTYLTLVPDGTAACEWLSNYVPESITGSTMNHSQI